MKRESSSTRHQRRKDEQLMCGILAAWKIDQAAPIVRTGLMDLLHRGQDSAGIVGITRSGELRRVGGKGLATEVLNFPPGDLPGWRAIGHTRYATTGDTDSRNIGPQLYESRRGPIAVAHNGNIVNALGLRLEQELCGATFQTDTDTETILQGYGLSTALSVEDALFETLAQTDGAYSIAIMTPDELIVGRDPRGMRPLSLATLNGGYVATSETCVIDRLGATFLRDVEPGEMIVFRQDGIVSHYPFLPKPPAFCVFEYIYLLSDNSRIGGVSVRILRCRLGAALASEAPPTDRQNAVILPVPNSGCSYAEGYATRLGMTTTAGIIRSEKAKRTFIEYGQNRRAALVDLKFSVDEELVRGRDCYVLDDSLVRGTTAEGLTRKLRAAGARSVHWRYASPHILYPCYYGINMSTRSELMAARYSDAEIARQIGADSVRFLSLDALEQTVPLPGQTCKACFTGRYPTPLPRETAELIHL